MASLQSHPELDEYADLFVGHAIAHVRYLGWWQEAPEEPGAYVEYVEIAMDDGAVLRVTTDPDDCGSYGISIYEGPYPGPADAIHVLDASGRGGWSSLLGAMVSEASFGWAEVEVVSVQVAKPSDGWPSRPVSLGTERVIVPYELALRFQGGGSVFLVAAAWDSDGTLISERDNVAVVFGDTDAERLMVGRWRVGRVA
jgi:hypothetical protein